MAKVFKEMGTLTCPYCKHKQQLEIYDNACTPFYFCDGCGKMVKAQKTCCIFCEFGDKPCGAKHISVKI